jgi:hypothetical protein
MFSRSRIVAALQLSAMVVLAIWIAAYAGIVGTTGALWLSLSVVGMAFFLTAISHQTEQPKSMSQILADLEDPRRSK